MNLVDYSIDNKYLYLLDFVNGVTRFDLKSMNMDKNFFIN